MSAIFRKKTALKNLSGTIKHTIIVFGGWGGMDGGGEPFPANPTQKSGTSILIDKLRNMSAPGDSRIVLSAYQGALNSMEGRSKALQFIRNNFDPRGKLIIYGYSAGGMNAIGLCHMVSNFFKWYDVSDSKFYGSGYPYSAQPPRETDNPNLGQVIVDELITVDASYFNGSGSRYISSCVRKNLNIYQAFPAQRAKDISSGVESETGSRAHGSANRAQDPVFTSITNSNWSSRYNDKKGGAHGKIDNDTIPIVIIEIRQLIGIIFDYISPPSNRAFQQKTMMG